MDFTIRRAGHVVLRVTDPFSARDFLEQVVGFQTFGQEGESFFFMTAHPVSNHHMIAVRAGKPGERLPEPERQIGMISISYEVSDLDELRRIYQRIKEQGPAYGVKILRTEDRGTIHNFICSDKDGNQIEFYSTVPDEASAGKAPFELRGTIDDELAHETEGAKKRVQAIKVAIRRTSHLTLRCKDLSETRAYYERMLHLFPIAETNGRVYLSGDPATRRPVLALEQATETNVPVPTPRAMFGMEHFSLEVGSFEQLQAAFRHLNQSGAHVHHTVDHGVTNSVYLIDPDRNLIEIYHDVPRAEYRNPENPFGSFGSIEDRLASTH